MNNQGKGRLKLIGKILGICFLILVAAGAYKSREIYRFYKVVTLFDKGNITENFRTMSDIFPATVIKRSGDVSELIIDPQPLPKSCTYDGKTYDFAKLMADTQTTGLLVLKENRILFEAYYLGADKDTRHISWSVGKSFLSAIFGIAVEEGLIRDIMQPVTDYAPELKGSGYDGVPIKHVLQMSSGVRFNEDYADFNSDINRMGRTIALGNSINEFAGSLSSEKPPGEYHHYVSMDTQVLGMVLMHAADKSLSAYLEEKIWSKLGMRSDARWMLDDLGMELAFGTLNVTTRDYARFGKLYAQLGNWNGEQIVPEQWVRDSVTPDAPHLLPGDNPRSSSKMGYGYQWWIPEHPMGDFMALGVYGQYIYVHPGLKVVIVKNSADPDWRSGSKTNYIIMSCFQQVAEALK